MGLVLFSILCLMLYAIFLWSKTKHLEPINRGSISKLTVIVPFKNESQHLPQLCSDLRRELRVGLYPVRVLFINDNSSDGGEQQLNTAINQEVYDFEVLNSKGAGKKQAIETALAKCNQDDWILTLDADVRLPPGYFQSLFALGVTAGLNVLGLEYPNPKSLLQCLVWIESTLQKPLFSGYYFAKKPSLCSGAHLLYPKHFFKELNPYQNNRHILSGDDMFLLDAALTKNKKIASHKLSLSTQYPKDFKHFFSQRMRWMGKGVALKSNYYHRSTFLFAFLLFTQSVLVLDWPLFFMFCLMRLLLECIYLSTHTKSFLPYLLLPVYWLYQYSIPLLFIFGLKRNGQTW